MTLLAPPADEAGPDRTRRRLERALAAAGAVAWEWELRAGKTGLAEGFLAAVHPADRDWLVRAVAAAARGEAPYDFEFRLLGANGAIEWVHDLAQLERDAAGRPLRLAGVARLVTARRRAEAALRATFEQAPVGMAHVSLGGAFTRVNDRLCRFLDRPREVLLSLGFQDVTHPADLAADLALVGDLLAGRAESYAMEKRYLRGDGAVAWGRLTVSLARDADGAPDHFVSLVEDVSEHRTGRPTGHKRADTTGGAARRDLPVVLAAREAELARVQRIGRIGGFEVDLRDPAFIASRSPEDSARQALPPGVDREPYEVWLTRLHPDDRARADATLRQALASGGTRYENEYRIVRTDGETRWIAASGEIERDPAGRPLRLIGAHQDITDRKRAEVALAEAEREARARLNVLEAIYATAPVGLAVFSPDLRYLRINERLAKINGIPAAAHIGRTVREIVPDFADQAEAVVRRILDTGEPVLNLEFTGEIPAQPGVRRTWIAGWTPVRGPDGAIGAINVVAEEVTERRAAEAQTLRLLQIIERSNAFVATATLDGRVTYMNASGRRMIGLTETADIGDLRGADYVMPDSLALLRESVIPTARDKGVWEGEMRLVNMRTGAPIEVHRSTFALRDPDGTHSGYGAVTRNITEQKRAAAALAESEANLHRLNEELEARVQTEVAAREAAQTQLAHSERMQVLGQLAGGIAHDFNNVMQAVGGGAALIERRANDPERVRGLARMMAEAVARGAAITRRLLHFSRRADLQTEPVDAASLLAGLREILAVTLGAGLDVRIEAPDGLPLLLADKGQLETALINLATNGRDAMAGRGTLTLTAAADAVPPGGGTSLAVGSPPNLEPGSYVRLSVSDTGTGMDAATLARAMEPFFTTKPLDQGTGLGLAMASGFARQSGGDLRIDSALGCGTTVTMWLPAAEAETALAAAGQVAGPGPGGRHGRLMLVDDDVLVLDVMAGQMEEAGYTVLALESGDEALARLDAGEAVDLIVSDMSMPGMDGVTLVREAQRRRPGLPAILLTGFVTSLAEIAVGEAVGGLLTLLRKPVEGKVLAERVAVLLERRLGPETDR